MGMRMGQDDLGGVGGIENGSSLYPGVVKDENGSE